MHIIRLNDIFIGGTGKVNSLVFFMESKFFAVVLLLSILIIRTGAAETSTVEFDKALSPDGKLWELTPETFMASPENAGLFKFNSKNRNTAVYSASRKPFPRVRFLGFQVFEIIARFKQGKLGDLDISLYNRGDLGNISKEKFKALVVGIFKKLNTWAGEKGKSLPSTRIAGKKSYSRIWVKKPYTVKLMWSFSGAGGRFKAEFANLDISRFNPENDPRKRDFTPKTVKKVEKKPLTANVVKKNGDVYISNVPMVDQGAKGYCAVATTERVFRYFGIDADQHRLAQITETGDRGGTSLKEMISTLKRAGVKFRVRLKEQYSDDSLESYNKFIRWLNKYNRTARKMKKPRVEITNPKYRNGDYVNLTRMYQDFDPDVFVEARCKNDRTDYRKFYRYVVSNINQGIPILWAVLLGVVPDKNIQKQALGGHMRLIIGYNPKTKDIIYTDTWGKGHEFKKIPEKNAWAMTTGLLTFIPRD